MLKSRITYILFLMLVSTVGWSQQYRVCDVSSSPAAVKLAGGKTVAKNNIVDGKDVLKFEKYSKISLMEMKTKEVYFFAGEGEFTVAEVADRNKTQIKSNLKAHVKDLMQGKSHSKIAGVVYKDFGYPVNFLEGDNLLVVNEQGTVVQIGEISAVDIYYFVVTNPSDTPYFVNVIRTDSKGNRTACCISNDASAQMDLLIPAEGSAILTSFPQLGKDLMGSSFKVAASEAPFDARALLAENPYVQLLSPCNNSTVSYPNLTIRFLIKDTEKIKSVDAFLNGAVVADNISVVDGVNELKLELAKYGENQIELDVVDNSGYNYPNKISVNYERLNKPRLHILSVGIGNYKNPNIDKLHYAASDAAIVAQVLDTLRNMNLNLYKEGGYRMLLVDNDATRGTILKCLDDVRYEADPEDIVMIYMSGHGKFVEFTSQRYFLPVDVEDDKYIESTAISYSELKAKLKQLEDKECKVVVYMDACYAGEMYYAKAAGDFIGDSEPAVIGFYSSTRNQPSLEKVELNHGVFTYALLNGIKGGAGDDNGNVTITSLGDYITEQVRIQSDGRQTPKVDNGGEDFILFKVSDGEINVSAPAAVGKMSGKKESANNDIIALAESYYTGAAVAATMEDEFKVYIEAAGKGDANSMYMAGVCYETGKGCTPDPVQALSWYGKAAAKGIAAAQYNLGAMHYNGTGTLQSDELAEKWFKEAVAKGYSKAYTALGHLYYHKASPDYKKAFECFSKAAQDGDAMAMYYLGECYLNGYGTVEDISAALDAYKKSAAKGYEAAQEKLMEIEF